MADLPPAGSTATLDRPTRTGAPPVAPRPSSRAVLSYLKSALDRPMASQHLVLGSAGLLLALGTMMVLSASSYTAAASAEYGGDAYYFAKRQVVFLCLGLVVALITVRLRLGALRALSWVALFGSLLLLILTYVPGLGSEINGNRNWLQVGPAWMPGIQPSEFAKIAIVLWGADVLARKEKLLDQPRHLLVPYLPVTGIMVLLVIFQGDLGTALVMLAMVFAVLWMVGAPLRVFAGLIVGAAGAVAVLVLTSRNRVERFLGFLNPDADKLGVNMQPTVGIEAIASGGWWGVGLGGSRQKWGRLAEAHTDYIFAVIGEELGLFGSLAVLALFLVLGYAGLRIALRSDQPFHRYLASGITAWFLVQAMINLAVVLRLGPVMGVPLPLLSYGGSSLLATMIAVALLISCARAEPEARALISGRHQRQSSPRVTAVVAETRP